MELALTWLAGHLTTANIILGAAFLLVVAFVAVLARELLQDWGVWGDEKEEGEK
jgi:hypothetical protein